MIPNIHQLIWIGVVIVLLIILINLLVRVKERKRGLKEIRKRLKNSPLLVDSLDNPYNIVDNEFFTKEEQREITENLEKEGYIVGVDPLKRELIVGSSGPLDSQQNLNEIFYISDEKEKAVSNIVASVQEYIEKKEKPVDKTEGVLKLLLEYLKQTKEDENTEILPKEV